MDKLGRPPDSAHSTDDVWCPGERLICSAWAACTPPGVPVEPSRLAHVLTSLKNRKQPLGTKATQRPHVFGSKA